MHERRQRRSNAAAAEDRGPAAASQYGESQTEIKLQKSGRAVRQTGFFNKFVGAQQLAALEMPNVETVDRFSVLRVLSLGPPGGFLFGIRTCGEQQFCDQTSTRS